MLAAARECVDHDELKRAELVLAEVLRRDPRSSEAARMLASVCGRLGRPEDALGALEEVLAESPADAASHASLAATLRAAGRVGAAIESWRRAIVAEPRAGSLHDSLGLACMDAGRFEEAESSFRRALELEPTLPGVCLNLSRCRRFSRDDTRLIDRIRAVLDHGLSGSPRADVHFALGKIHDDLDDVDTAFEHYQLGNRLVAAEVQFDADQHAGAVDALIETFTAVMLERTRHFGDPSDVPIFIVGMPRSGTSLVEQMLAAHPGVLGGGERAHLNDISRRIAGRLGSTARYPRCVAELDAETALALGAEYVSRLPARGRAEQRVTDKLPTNFLHLGLIALLLPNARVIHCTRGAMDTAFSIYAQQFESGHVWAYDFADIAAFYREHDRLMTYWRASLSLSVLEVVYEDLVERSEAQCRRLVEHCGLAWDPACLAFHQAPRAVATASNWQVRQPLYRSSVQRWRRYERHLTPLRRALEREGVL